ncbi:MAG: peptide ABC transporter substrate-binding protein, partial [Thermomicrobiales bacterium]
MQFSQRAALHDPEMLARLERNLRSAGMPRRRFLAVAGAAAGAAALAACGGGNSTATTVPTTAPVSPAATSTDRPESKKVLIVSTTVEPVDNDVNRDLGGYGQISQCAGLLQYDQHTQIQPDLAESYTNSGNVYTFKMRAGAAWSDGVPITAMDFVYSVRRMIDPRTGNGYASFWNGVIKGAAEFSAADRKAPADQLDTLAHAVGVRAVDAGIFEVTGGDFFGLIPSQFAFKAAYPAREDQVKKFTDAQGVSSWTDPGKTGAPIVSSGPFVLTAWKHNQQIDFVRNEQYWNAGTIRQKYLTVKIIPDLVRSTLPYENSDIDFQEIPPTEVARFKNDGKLKSQVSPVINPFTRFLVPDTGHSPFDSLEVRRATILAVDKERLVKQVGKGVHTVAYAMTAPGVFGYFDDGDNRLKNLQKYDPKAAMEALKGTAFEGGRNWPKVTLSYNASDTDIPAGTPDEIARQLKETLNMDVQIEPLEGKVWNARRYTLDLQFLLYRWGQDYPTCANLIRGIVSSRPLREEMCHVHRPLFRLASAHCRRD